MYISSDGAWAASEAHISQYTVVVDGATAVFHQQGAFMTLYSGRGGDLLSSPMGPYTGRDGTIYKFGSDGYLNIKFISEIDRPDGEILTFYYKITSNGGSLLTSVVSNAGYMMHSENGVWTASNLAIDYCDPAAIHCDYSRAWPRMTRNAGSYTDGLGRTTSVTSTGGAATVTYPSGRYVSIVYGTGGSPTLADAGHVVSLTNGEGTWTYAWTWDPNINPLEERPVTIVRHDPLGRTLSGVSFKGSLQTKTDELLRVTGYGVDHVGPNFGQVVSLREPEGLWHGFGFDPNNRGNLPQVSTTSKDGTQTLTLHQNFPTSCTNVNTCNLPSASIDANGNQTDYTYYDWGGIKTERGPSVDGGRPLKRYFYTQLYAYIKNSSGALVQAASPIWRLTQTIECRQLANSEGTGCGSSADETVTNFEYGAAGTVNALLVHGKVEDVTGAALRTCYGYDAIGNLISETKPRAGLSSCS